MRSVFLINPQTAASRLHKAWDPFPARSRGQVKNAIMIIGVTGFFAAGKDSVADYLTSRKGFIHLSLSDMIRERLRRDGTEITIPNLTAMGNQIRRDQGPGALGKLAVRAMMAGRDYVVTSIRHPAEVEALRQVDDFRMVFVDAPIRVRYERSLSRGRAGDAQTFEEFQTAEQAQMNSNDSAAQRLADCRDLADHVIINDQELTKLYEAVEALWDAARQTLKANGTMKPSLLQAIQERVLLSDGAMGTQIQNAGLQPGECGELWALDHPDALLAIQKRYADAGADCITTNTFGASSIVLKGHGLADRVAEINAAAVRVARQAIGDNRYVLGDLGPLGEIFEPFGSLTHEAAVASFTEQAAALIEAGVDAIIIETMTAMEEIKAAIEAVRTVSEQIPIIASMAYDKTAQGGYATMMGVRPEIQAAELTDSGADMIASNCGTGISAAEHVAIITAFASACDKPIMSQPNAGSPEVTSSGIIYHEAPEKMAEQIPALVRAGARIVGGCCGTTPEHIACFRRVLDKLND